MKISRKKLKMLIENYLNEQEGRRYLGFLEDASNPSVLRVLKPEAPFMKQTLEKLGFENISNNKPYYVDKSFYDQFMTGAEEAKFGYELGISSKSDKMYRYVSLGNNKFKSVVATTSRGLGKEFTKKLDLRTSDNTEMDDMPSSSFDERDVSYKLGNRGKYNNISGTKLIARSGSGKISVVYFIPDGLPPNMIQKRIPGGEFKFIDDEKEINTVVKEYEKLSGKNFGTSLNINAELFFPLPKTKSGGEFKVTSRPDTKRQSGPHGAYDYACPVGTPVYSIAAGKVIRKTTHKNAGNYYSIAHTINGEKITTQYCHLSKFVVEKDDNVSAGQLIGYSGNTGRSTGPHLHFSIWNGHAGFKYVNKPENPELSDPQRANPEFYKQFLDTAVRKDHPDATNLLASL